MSALRPKPVIGLEWVATTATDPKQSFAVNLHPEDIDCIKWPVRSIISMLQMGDRRPTLFQLAEVRKVSAAWLVESIEKKLQHGRPEDP